MDVDKLKQWLDMAQKFQGNHFWSDIFDQDAFQNNLNNQGHQQPHSVESNHEAPKLPLVDILIDNQYIVILIDLPAVQKDDLQLSIGGDKLFLQGTIRSLYPNMTSITSERLSGTFNRTIILPEQIGDQQVKARFVQGILEIRLNRITPTRKDITID